jgi:high-affinity Fe2+/Pb2+ permease
LASKDAGSKIKLLQQQVDAKDAAMTKAIKDKNKAELESLNNSLNQIWTSNETSLHKQLMTLLIAKVYLFDHHSLLHLQAFLHLI